MNYLNACIDANGLFRSQEMEFFRLTMPRDTSYQILYSLGHLNCCHFVDLNPNMICPPEYDPSWLLSAKKRVMDCSHYQRRLYNLETKIKEFKLQLPPPYHEMSHKQESLSHSDVLINLNEFLTPFENQLQNNLHFKEEVDQQITNIREHLHVLKLFHSLGEGKDQKEDIKSPLLSSSVDDGETHILPQSHSILRYIAGVIPYNRIQNFQKVIFRVSRGKCLFRTEPIIDDQLLISDAKLEKHVFVIYFVGSLSGPGHLERKIKKLCDAHQANVYQIPDSAYQIEQTSNNLRRQLYEKQQAVNQTSKVIKESLDSIIFDDKNQNSPLRYWQREILIEMSVYENIKMTLASQNFMTAKLWIPASKVTLVEDEINYMSRVIGHSQVSFWKEQTEDDPPTYFEHNAVTSSFQAIVDTYGVPRYREVNPGLYTIITFPFLFGVMFGDIGHGLLLLFFSFFLFYKSAENEEKNKRGELSEIIGMLHHGRYMILFMSLWAIYVGLIYNDCLSLPIDLFGTNYSPNTTSPSNFIWNHQVYPFGIDPVWHGKANGMSYYNSLKMKFSVIIGVIQMLFGTILSFFNNLHFGNHISIIMEFIPQFLFMICLFGYMDFMIFYKWTIDWTERAKFNQTDPNLVQTFMNIFLNPTHLEGGELFANQLSVQSALKYIAILCVPVLFLGKPLFKLFKHCYSRNQQGPSYSHIPINEDLEIDIHKSQPSFSFSEELIKQGIHSIEYILGAVSNTASYLRLWALSLSHAELSEVFWDRIFVLTLELNFFFAVVVGFAMWFAVTIIVLLCMDSLECFLHALRLHWVEWHNKFFYGDGYHFRPFSFSDILLEAAKKKSI